jgi:RNA polymerase sigma-70 factor (ECF subfamily)
MAVELGSEAMCALHQRGREAWPGVELDIATFSKLAAGHLRDASLDDVRAADLYLAMACTARVDRAISALDKHYLSRLAPALIRQGQDGATAADVVQTVRVRFLVGEAGRTPRIAEYDGRGSLANWLRVAAVRTAISTYRKHHRETAIDEVTIVAAAPSPELAELQQRFGAGFRAAFRCAFEALTPRERNLLRYQVVDRLGIDRIAAFYGVHRATAARWVAHARDSLCQGVRRALQDQLRIGTEELDSLFRELHSKLELSLRLFLTPTPETGRADGPAPQTAQAQADGRPLQPSRRPGQGGRR